MVVGDLGKGSENPLEFRASLKSIDVQKTENGNPSKATILAIVFERHFSSSLGK